MAKPSHKRDTNARWITFVSTPFAAKVAAPLAAVATLGVVVAGVTASTTPDFGNTFIAQQQAAAIADAIEQSELAETPEREPQASRSGGRDQDADAAEDEAADERAAAVEQEKRATEQAVANASEERWATTDLNLWDGPTESAEQVGLLEAGKKTLITGRERSGRTEIVVSDQSRWVTSGYFTDKEPTANTGVGGTCSNGSSVPSGVRPNVKKVHQSVCARFPELTSYGTLRGDGEHAQGRAIDVMVSGSRGWEVADYLRANASALGIEYLIYAQKIWSVDRAGEGWRGMSNRGSSTANHFDHVHVTVY